MADITQDQLKDLVDILRAILPHNQETTEATQKLLAALKPKSTMATCNVRFNGTYEHAVVEEFINAVQIFKDLENITDEDALKSISLLFKDTAAIWWQGIRNQAETWQDCLKLLREHFSPRKPAHQLYAEIFQTTQNDKVGINLFVIDKRNLMAQLPEGRHDETTEIDFIYSLLNIKYRQYMRREEIKTFQDLLEKGRDIERNIMEMTDMEKSKPKRCSYCNYRGHMVEECRRRQPIQQQQQTSADSKKTVGNTN